MKDIQKRSDDELVSLYVGGLNEAFDVLIERYDDELLSYIQIQVGNSDIADDLFQDTFMKVIQVLRAGSYQTQGKFRQWLFRVAHNLVIDHFRRTKTQKVYSIHDDQFREEFIDRFPSPSLNMEEILVEQNNRDLLRTCVARLPKEQRDVLVLRFRHDMSFKEIASYTGVSINTALGRMRYALMNLRKMAPRKVFE
ncbi:MAG: sigma-70 family RNA polymerase sigma factor [Bacteroidales bacterium]|nr:sigma-70 family RNA polymerase sigma factor [Porphyromonas sp.]MDD6934646.1 sigma-70 family RNA polymerase sigma factor [Bacteroidales bacterium]MDY3102664.1 sigma-70 family RNA polymerase sigma factor [Porphyromonas sp.]